MASQVIVEVGGEGGSLAVFGEKNAAGEWKFGTNRNETAAYDMLSEEDRDGIVPSETTGYTQTFGEAIARIDRYPWFLLYPLGVHPEFHNAIFREVRMRGGKVEERRWREQFEPEKHFSLPSAKAKFLHHFPAGFSDPLYLKNERLYKITAHDDFQRLFVKGEVQYLLDKNEIGTLVKRCLSVVGRLNLLSRYEKSAFRDAMQDHDAARTFFSALLGVIRSDMIYARDFEFYLETVSSLPAKRGTVATWPVATIFPYITQPTRHMFLKPLVTKAAAQALGFDLEYKTALNWITYASLLRMGHVYLELLEEMGAQDFIDIQSFIFVVGGGYD